VLPKLEDTITVDFITSSSSGAAADADSTPTFEVFEDATDTALTLSGSAVAKRTGKTGDYRITLPCTAANGFEAGKSYNVVAAATVGGVAAKAVVARFLLRARSVDDLLPTASYTAPMGATQVANAVWDTLAAGHVLPNTFGALVGALPGSVWTTALVEAYRATGATGTGAQLLYEILQNLTEFAISGTTKTVKKLDGTTAKTYTTDDATAPTSITEAT
jgi:hypothetical protein